MRTGLGTFKVGENTYKFEELAPMDALRFGTQCAKVLGPALTSLANAAGAIESGGTVGGLVERLAPALAGIEEDKMEALLKTSFSHVYTPHNGHLGDEVVFNAWFSEHKGDLFVVGVTALYYLAKDFFPKVPAI